MIPSLKIPAKVEQLEGRDKIQQQIELSQQLNKQKEAGELTKLEQSLSQNNSKFQVLMEQKNSTTEVNLSQKVGFDYKETIKTAKFVKPNKEALMTEQAFYLKERQARPIYQDEDLHVLMLSLIFCLLLKPERGILDDLYCSQYPIDNGKQNILFLLHHHMNHQENEKIIQKILKRVQEINPPLAGLRLLKLLCNSLFDLGMYNNGKDWKKLAEGAYAKVYENKTNLSEPQAVAIKQMLLPNSIYDRCVLHDIFTEITCLEELRLEPCVSDLYDFGVDNTSYYIVMKRYASSLREWRIKQNKSLNENLSLYLSIYREFLKSLQIIHSHNVTHYDIKCDNVFLDFENGQGNSLSNQWAEIEEDRIKITVGDFGECKIFSGEKDELCQRNRGTDFCKSPEMLQLTINTRKDTDKYDRRKQVGTNRLSDVWSAGCMFYELLTGEFLFYTPDYLQFHFRVTRPSEALFTPDKLEKINNNIYLIDFLKYMLVRDPHLRPSIENVLKRFEHVHALLVSTSSANGRNNLSIPVMPSNIRGQTGFDSLLDQAQQIMIQNSQVYGGEIKEENLKLNEGDENCNNISEIYQVNYEKNYTPFIMQIMEDVFLSNNVWIKQNTLQAVKMGITHIIIEERYCSQTVRDQFDVQEIPEYSDLLIPLNLQENQINPFLMMPILLDFMRRAALQKGRILFIEDQRSCAKMRRGVIQQQLIRECLILCLNHIFQTNAYEAYTLIKSQNLLFKISSERLATISKWVLLSNKISQYLSTFPRFQCACGSCLIILKRQFANYSNMHSITCNCCQYYKNIETSQCPSPGCNEFIHFMRTFFKTSFDSLHWGFLEEEDFMLGPCYLGALAQNTIQCRMIASNLSQTVDKNSSVVSVIEKKSHNQGGARGLKDVITMDYNLISKSSATAKNYQYGYARWKLFKCKECHVWTHAINENENRFALLLNNRVKENKNVNIRNLNSKQAGNQGVRVPILQRIKLSTPF